MQDISISLQGIISVHPLERQKLVELLWKCVSMSDPDARDMVVADLPEEIQSLMKRNRNIPKLDIRHIVDACLNYEGGLIKLIETMKVYETNSDPLKAAAKFVEELYATDAHARKKAQYETLRPILSQISEANLAKVDLERLYSASQPDNYLSKWDPSRGRSRIETLFSMWNTLSGAMPKPGEVPAIFKFIEHIAITIPSKKISNDLQSWVDTTAQKWNIEPQKIDELRKNAGKTVEEEKSRPLEASTGEPPYLLIMLMPVEERNREQCSPENCCSAKFSVEAWLHYGKDTNGKDDINCLHVSKEGETYTSVTISKLFIDLLTQVARSTKITPEMKNRLAIDFFLPREFFCCPVEHWLIEGNATIGGRNRVVIRSSERLINIKDQYKWGVKWTRVQNLLQDKGVNPIHWINCQEELDGAFYKLIAESVVCLGLKIVPPPVVDPYDKKELFYNLISTGTPIAIWPRYLPKSQKSIRAIVKSRQLSTLPEQILKQRREALGRQDKGHLGYCLALLWDDPNRVPPTIAYEEIRVRKDVNDAG